MHQMKHSSRRCCQCPSVSSHLQSCKKSSVWKEKCEEEEKKPDLAGGRFVCSHVCLSVRYAQVNHSSFCMSISKPVYLPNSHLIFLYLYCDRKQICTFCTACWIYTNRDFIQSEHSDILYSLQRQNIHHCGLMPIQNACFPRIIK